MEVNETNFIEICYRLKRLSELLNEISIQEIPTEKLEHADELYTLLGALAERLHLNDTDNRETRELINKIKFEVDSPRKAPSLDDMVNEIVSGVEKLPKE